MNADCAELSSASRSSSVTERPSSREASLNNNSSAPSTPTSFNRISPVRDRYTFTGNTYSYVGQSPLSKQSSERPNAARKTRSSALKLSNSFGHMRDVSPVRTTANSESATSGISQRYGPRRTSRINDQFERSTKGTADGLYGRAGFAARLPMSNAGTGSRGVPHALLTDMQLFRKLYMNQLEKEARREVEEQYAKNKQQTRQNGEENQKSEEGVEETAATPSSNFDMTIAIENPSPRMSILKQPKPSSARAASECTTPNRKRVSFSADVLPGVTISS